MRALEASLSDGSHQPSYFEADLMKIKGLLHDWKTLWDKATPQERQDIVAALFGEVRLRVKAIVSATLADPRTRPSSLVLRHGACSWLRQQKMGSIRLGWRPRTGSGARKTNHPTRWRGTRRGSEHPGPLERTHDED